MDLVDAKDSPSVAPPEPAVRSPSPRTPGRRLVESLLLFLCILLVFRVVGVEPYSVPTGSMAPALLGFHWACDCPRCGYPVRVGAPNGAGDRPGHAPGVVHCPNCGDDHFDLDLLPITRGDQLLVNKNAFDWRTPRRWEMAVFRCPVLQEKEFVKRVVGLPGELVQIRQGDIQIDHELARKTLDEFKRLRLPLFDQEYQPAPDGWSLRWVALAAQGVAEVQENSLSLDSPSSAQEPVWLTYRHWLLDLHKEEAIRDEYSYNGSERGASSTVHDFMLECDLEVVGGNGAVFLGITDGGDDFTVEFPVSAVREGVLLRRHGGAEATTCRTAPDFVLSPGRTYRVELAFVDRRVSLAVDGRPLFAPLDRPWMEDRKGVSRPVKVGARAAAVRVHHVRLFRDVHYTEMGQHGVKSPLRLGAGHYFVLGDNSPNSDDSRFWSDRQGRAVPVPESNFVGKPFMVHLPSRVKQWQCFGRQWQHQGIDWGRIRWLR